MTDLEDKIEQLEEALVRAAIPLEMLVMYEGFGDLPDLLRAEIIKGKDATRKILDEKFNLSPDGRGVANDN